MRYAERKASCDGQGRVIVYEEQVEGNDRTWEWHGDHWRQFDSDLDRRMKTAWLLAHDPTSGHVLMLGDDAGLWRYAGEGRWRSAGPLRGSDGQLHEIWHALAFGINRATRELTAYGLKSGDTGVVAGLSRLSLATLLDR